MKLYLIEFNVQSCPSPNSMYEGDEFEDDIATLPNFGRSAKIFKKNPSLEI